MTTNKKRIKTMERNKRKKFKEKPLYRKVNTTCHGGKLHHGSSSNDEYRRGSKDSIEKKSKMKSGNQYHGLDFSPLYAYLRKHVGEKWSDIYSKIKPRLPEHSRFDPLESTVLTFQEYTMQKENGRVSEIFGHGESSTHSTLYIDENDILQFVNPNLTAEEIGVSCRCCTHTFNGKLIPLSTFRP